MLVYYSYYIDIYTGQNKKHPYFIKQFSCSQSDDDDSGNESEDPDNPGKRRKFDEATIERRIEKRKWTERRYTLFIREKKNC